MIILSWLFFHMFDCWLDWSCTWLAVDLTDCSRDWYLIFGHLLDWLFTWLTVLIDCRIDWLFAWLIDCWLDWLFTWQVTRELLPLLSQARGRVINIVRSPAPSFQFSHPQQLYTYLSYWTLPLKLCSMIYFGIFKFTNQTNLETTNWARYS